MTWDVARIWSALDTTYNKIHWVTKRTKNGEPNNLTPQRIEADHLPSLTPSSRTMVLRHLLWMLEETKQHAADGKKSDKALRWLGFIQGASWALGLLTVQDARDINRKPDLVPPKVDDAVLCLGEAQTLFRVVKVSSGVEEGTGSAYLIKVHTDEDHGWEDFQKLRVVAQVKHGSPRK